MASVTDVTIGATSTSIITAATWKTLGGPVYLKNESAEVVTLTISGADTYDLDPGEPIQVLPGQVVTGTAVGGAAKLQIIAGIVPADESAAKSGGAVVAAGSASVAASRASWSVSQGDFTAIIASANTLTLGAFPTALGTPDDGDFYLVMVTDVNGLQTAYVPTRNAMTLSGQVLTVAGAAFDAADLDYDVWIWGPPKSYDAAENTDQMRDISPLWARTQNPTLVNVTNQTDGTVPYYIDFAGYKYGVLSLVLSCDAGTVTATLLGSTDESVAAASATYHDITLEMFGVSSLVASAGSASDDWVIDTPLAYKHLKLQIVYATGGNTGDALGIFRGIY